MYVSMYDMYIPMLYPYPVRRIFVRSMYRCTNARYVTYASNLHICTPQIIPCRDVTTGSRILAPESQQQEGDNNHLLCIWNAPPADLALCR